MLLQTPPERTKQTGPGKTCQTRQPDRPGSPLASLHKRARRASPFKTDQRDLARCPCLSQGSVQGLPSQPRSAAYCPVVLPRIPASQPVQPLPAFSESPAAPDSMPSRRSPDTVPGLPLFVRPVVSASAARTPIAPGLCLDSPGHSFWPSGLFGPSCPWGLFGLLRLPLSPLRLCWGKPRGRRGLHARHDLGNRCGWCGWYGWCDSGVCEGRETRELGNQDGTGCREQGTPGPQNSCFLCRS